MSTQPAKLVWLALAAVACTVGVDAASTVLANSQLQTCVNDGSSATTVVTCSQKLVVTLAVGSGTSLATEQLQFSVPCVNSPDGTCPCKCNYATDASCQCRDLTQAMNVVVTKTPVYATYPLTYLQSFNSKPYEGTILTGGSQPITSCEDGALSSSPTCGWATDETGAKITDSQGFCCTCTLSEIEAATLNGGTTQQTRGNLDCNLFVSLLHLPGSAHCLRFADLWYEGYSVGSSQLDFTITVAITTTTSGNAAPATETLSITPSTPLVLSSSGAVSANLLGDLATYTAMPVFSSSVLMIPHPAGMDVATVLTSNQSQWMVVDNTMISLDGTQCNLIGTSYTAFRYQAGGCNQLPGTCLANQLQDLYNADIVRVKAGTTPKYFVTRWGGGQTGAKQVFKPVTSGPLWFGLPITGISNSVLTLNVRADTLKLVVNESPGKILSAQVCTYDNATCGGFVAISQRGYLYTSVKNTGYIAADYTVTVSNCSVGVQPIVAQQVALDSQQTSELVFQIYMQSDTAAAPSCTLGLVDSLGKLTDSRAVAFSVNATVYDNKPTQSDVTDKLTGAGSPQSGPITCDQRCGSLWNVMCAVWHWCWARIFKLLAYVVGLFLLGSFIWLGISRGWFAALFRCVFGRGRRRHYETDEREAPSKRPGKTDKRARDTYTAAAGRDSVFGRMMAQMIMMHNPLAQPSASEVLSDHVTWQTTTNPLAGMLSKQRLLPAAGSSAYAKGVLALDVDATTPADTANVASPRSAAGRKHKAAQAITPGSDGSNMLISLQQAIARSASASPAQQREASPGTPSKPLPLQLSPADALQQQLQQYLVQSIPSGSQVAQQQAPPALLPPAKQVPALPQPQTSKLSPQQLLQQQIASSAAGQRQGLPTVSMGLSTPVAVAGWFGDASTSASSASTSTEDAVDALMAGYHRTGRAYLNLAKLGSAPPQLVAPGPAACVEGELQVVDDAEGAGLQLFFGVRRDQATQLTAYNRATGTYEKLRQPRVLDASKCSVLLPAETALQLLVLKPVGQCLNSD